MKKTGILREHSKALSIVLRLVDLFIVLVAAYIPFYLYLQGYVGVSYSFYDYRDPVVIGLALTAVLFPLAGLYGAWRGTPILKEVKPLTWVLCSVFISLAILSVITKTTTDYSRVWFGSWFLLSWVFLVFSRIVLRVGLSWMRTEGFNHRNVVVIGSGTILSMVIQRISESPWTGLRVVGVYVNDDDEINKADNVAYFNDIDSVSAYIEKTQVDQVWIAMPLSGEEYIEEILYKLRYSTVDIRYIPDIFGLSLLNQSITEIAGLPVVNLSVTPMDGINRWVKMCEDWLLALAIFILILPLMVLIAIGVKLSSPGPVIFKQLRHGWDGKPIRVYKFRTMVQHDEGCGGVITQAAKGDCRVTRFGEFLRKTSLDELPQFYNVLQGRMSIVGPRPHAVEHNNKYQKEIERYSLRHKVKPGITGWAQVNGLRGETDTLEKMQKRVEYDLFYIENWSLWFDLRIILLTLFKGFVNENAY